MRRRDFFKALVAAPVAAPMAIKAESTPIEMPSPCYSTILDPDGITRVYHYWGDKVICTEEIVPGGGRSQRMFRVENLSDAIKRWRSRETKTS